MQNWCDTADIYHPPPSVNAILFANTPASAFKVLHTGCSANISWYQYSANELSSVPRASPVIISQLFRVKTSQTHTCAHTMQTNTLLYFGIKFNFRLFRVKWYNKTHTAYATIHTLIMLFWMPVCFQFLLSGLGWDLPPDSTAHSGNDCNVKYHGQHSPLCSPELNVNNKVNEPKSEAEKAMWRSVFSNVELLCYLREGRSVQRASLS